MQQYIIKQSIRFFNFVVLMLSAIMVRAQDKIEIDKQEIGSWFERNWIWVAGGMLLIILIVLISRGKAGSRKTTTVIKDGQGHTKSVTTTEEKF
jgi:hypothetical protein